MPTDTAAEESTILGSVSSEDNGTVSHKEPSGEPSAKPDGQPAQNGSVQDATKPTQKDGKPTSEQPKPSEAPAVPEVYDLKVPDGLTLDEGVKTTFTALARELKLNNEQAQKFVDLQSKLAIQAGDEARAEYQKLKESWESESKKFLGSDATKTLALAAKARDKFGTPGLTDILNESGLGSHPEVVKFFVSIGKAISEDSFAEGKPVQGKANKTYGEIMYPTLPK